MIIRYYDRAYAANTASVQEGNGRVFMPAHGDEAQDLFSIAGQQGATGRIFKRTMPELAVKFAICFLYENLGSSGVVLGIDLVAELTHGFEICG